MGQTCPVGKHYLSQFLYGPFGLTEWNDWHPIFILNLEMSLSTATTTALVMILRATMTMTEVLACL